MDNTKEYIIDEAFKLFFNKSYEAVSINDISKAVGMTKGALYHHFKNKEDLFKLVVDKYLIVSRIEVDVESISLYDFIRINTIHAEKVIRSMYLNSDTFTPFNYMSLIADAFRHYPNYDQISREFINGEIGEITAILRNAIKTGEIRDDVNISIVASNFFSFKMGLAGNIARNYSIEQAISILQEQNIEYYKLLKRTNQLQ